jgi:hypothetical protein
MEKVNKAEKYLVLGILAIGVGLVVKQLMSAFERDDNIVSKETSKILSNPEDKKALLSAIEKIEKTKNSENIVLSNGKSMEIVM